MNFAISIIIILANFFISFSKFFFWQIYFSKLQKKPTTNFLEVIRNGEIQKICSSELLVGDLLKLKPGDMIEVDGIVVREKDLEIDESEIFDINISRRKVGYNFFKFSKKSHKSFILLSGSFVLKGEGIMLVCCVGKNALYRRQGDSYSAVLKIKNYKRNSVFFVCLFV
jgi:Ca2+-transporting ATPase